MTNLQTHRNKKPVAVFNLGELFCGPGGGALGAINANFNHDGEIWGFEHAWASDIDEDTCETFRHNICPHQPASVICQDVHELDIANLPNINAFSFGFPCNDFSLVGETNGLNGEYGPLYTYGVEVLNIFEPAFFLAENVGGIRGANEGRAFAQILNDLTNAGENGYTLYLTSIALVTMSSPKRNRVVIVGISNQEVEENNINFRIPAPITPDNPITAGEALNGFNRIDSDPRILNALETQPVDPEAANHNFTAHPKRVVERLQNIPPGHNAWNS